jgi:phosphoenolpyruvate synthase/pyruvate phosphate dikinase
MGGKPANLAVLIQNELPAPVGFCVAAGSIVKAVTRMELNDFEKTSTLKSANAHEVKRVTASRSLQ